MAPKQVPFEGVIVITTFMGRGGDHGEQGHGMEEA